MPSAAPASSPTSVSGSGAPPARSPVVAAGTSLGPWGAATVGGAAARAAPLAGDSSSLFALDNQRIVRLDPVSGAVLAAHRYGAAVYPPAVIAAHTLWMTPKMTAHALTVFGFDTRTLQPREPITVRLSAAADVGGRIGFTADPTANRLYLGIGPNIDVIDAATRRVLTVYRQPPRRGDVVALALSPDHTRLYATTATQAVSTASIVTLDAHTGTTLAPPIPIDDGVSGIAASVGGLWLQTGSGMSLGLSFHPNRDLSRWVDEPVAGGGGWPVAATPTRSAVWEGGTERIACADPASGKTRAKATVPAQVHDRGHASTNIADLTIAAGHLFAYYQATNAPGPYLIRLTPPRACTAHQQTSSNPPGLHICPAKLLRMTVDASGSVMSQPFADIALTNTGPSPCLLRGYPRLAVWGHPGWQHSPSPTVRERIVTQHGLYERRDPGPHLVVVRPHHNAYFSIGTATAYQGGLHIITLTRLAVGLPGLPDTKALSFRLNATRPPRRPIPIGITAVTLSPHP